MLKMGHFSLVVARTHNDTMMSDMDKALQGPTMHLCGKFVCTDFVYYSKMLKLISTHV